jgi:glycosyltransferase 2 family protein
MKKHLATIVVVFVFALLVYFQFRTWKTFDWHTMIAQTRGMSPLHLISGLVLIYFVYLLRAIRWKIFLKPRCNASLSGLIPSQFIGFTGLALLGRPGEFVRPYLIARKENLPFSSQLAVWAVERVFDMGTVALLLGFSLFFYRDRYAAFPQIQRGGIVLLVAVAAIALFVFAIWWKTELIANIFGSIADRFSRHIGHLVRERFTSFGEGLHTIHDVGSFAALLLISFAIWLCIAMAYWEVVHAYPAGPETAALHQMVLPDMLLVMASSMAGSIVQLPGVGGGSQLAVIGILSSKIFRLPRELAVSCGIMLWLITFVSVVPAGLLLAHRERISLRKLSEESHVQAES